MTKAKTISTLIPTFNRETYLKKAIQSCKSFRYNILTILNKIDF